MNRKPHTQILKRERERDTNTNARERVYDGPELPSGSGSVGGCSACLCPELLNLAPCSLKPKWNKEGRVVEAMGGCQTYHKV